VVPQPNFVNKIIAPFAIYMYYYLLMCAAPFLIVAVPMKFGPTFFSAIVCWRLVSNGGITYYALTSLEDHYLTAEAGLMYYGVSLAIAVFGLILFFTKMDPGFKRSLFWSLESGRSHNRDCWVDEEIWNVSHNLKTQDDEKYCIWVEVRMGEERSDEPYTAKHYNYKPSPGLAVDPPHVPTVLPFPHFVKSGTPLKVLRYCRDATAVVGGAGEIRSEGRRDLPVEGPWGGVIDEVN